MKINKLDINRNEDGSQIFTFALVTTIALGTIFGFMCAHGKKVQDKKLQDRIDMQEAGYEIFDEGEHIIAVPIEDPTSKVHEYQYYDGYTPVAISVAAYGKGSYHFDKAYILYKNTTPVMAYPNDKNEEGEFIYEEFGTPLKQEEREIKQDNETITYLPGEHIVSVPFSEFNLDLQFDSYEGYEPIGFANSTYGQVSAHKYKGCILYVNNEEVVVRKNITNGELPFGTPTGNQLTK